MNRDEASGVWSHSLWGRTFGATPGFLLDVLGSTSIQLQNLILSIIFFLNDSNFYRVTRKRTSHPACWIAGISESSAASCLELVSTVSLLLFPSRQQYSLTSLTSAFSISCLRRFHLCTLLLINTNTPHPPVLSEKVEFSKWKGHAEFLSPALNYAPFPPLKTWELELVVPELWKISGLLARNASINFLLNSRESEGVSL